MWRKIGEIPRLLILKTSSIFKHSKQRNYARYFFLKIPNVSLPIKLIIELANLAANSWFKKLKVLGIKLDVSKILDIWCFKFHKLSFGHIHRQTINQKPILQYIYQDIMNFGQFWLSNGRGKKVGRFGVKLT